MARDGAIPAALEDRLWFATGRGHRSASSVGELADRSLRRLPTSSRLGRICDHYFFGRRRRRGGRAESAQTSDAAAIQDARGSLAHDNLRRGFPLHRRVHAREPPDGDVPWTDNCSRRPANLPTHVEKTEEIANSREFATRIDKVRVCGESFVQRLPRFIAASASPISPSAFFTDGRV
jgi:hypothetical protein